MAHPNAHEVKWTVKYLATGALLHFDTEEDARSHCLMYGHATPMALIGPIYG